MQNIILIGMPGSGKSTVGVLAAKSLGMPFVDTDLMMQTHYGRLLQDLVDQMGEKGFLAAEEAFVSGLDVSGSIVATGGSVALEEKAMTHLKRNGVIVYLHVPYLEITRRLRNIATRGIAMGKGQSLQSLYDARLPHYQRHADLTIDGTGLTAEDTVSALVARLAARRAAASFSPNSRNG